jgi:hypothetical protein
MVNLVNIKKKCKVLMKQCSIRHSNTLFNKQLRCALEPDFHSRIYIDLRSYKWYTHINLINTITGDMT